MKLILNFKLQETTEYPDYTTCGQGSSVPDADKLNIQVYINGDLAINVTDFSTLNGDPSYPDTPTVIGDYSVYLANSVAATGVTNLMITQTNDNPHDEISVRLVVSYDGNIYYTYDEVINKFDYDDSFTIYLSPNSNGYLGLSEILDHGTIEITNAPAKVIVFRDKYTPNIYYYPGMSMHEDCIVTVLDEDGNLVSEGKSGILYSTTAATYTYKVVSPNGEECTTTFSVDDVRILPAAELEVVCSTCVDGCDYEENEEVSVKISLDFSGVKDLQYEGNGDYYGWETLTIDYVVVNVLDEEIDDDSVDVDIKDADTPYDSADSEWTFTPTTSGDMIVTATLIFKDWDGNPIYQCVLIKTITVCPEIDIEKVECNNYKVINHSVDSLTYRVYSLDTEGEWTELTTSAQTVVAGTSDEYDLVNDGVYKFTVVQGDTTLEKIIVAHCNLQECLFGKVVALANGKICTCECLDKDNVKLMYEFSSASVAGFTFFMLLNSVNLTTAYQTIDDTLLSKLIDIKCLVEKLNNYCCDNSNEDCGCS